MSDVLQTTSAAKGFDYEMWIFWALVVLAIWLSDWVPFRSEYSVYEMSCAQVSETGSCEARHERPASVTHYKPVAESKTVVYWGDNQPVMKLEDCAIVDAQNWACYQTYGQIMNDGELLSKSDKAVYPQQVSKLKWWWLKFKSF